MDNESGRFGLVGQGASWLGTMLWRAVSGIAGLALWIVGRLVAALLGAVGDIAQRVAITCVSILATMVVMNWYVHHLPSPTPVTLRQSAPAQATPPVLHPAPNVTVTGRVMTFTNPNNQNR